MSSTSTAVASPRSMFTTAGLAAVLNLSPQTLHKHHSKHGHFYGVRPVKLNSARGGRLLWPADSLEQIVAMGR